MRAAALGTAVKSQDRRSPTIPKAWDEAALTTLEVPAPDPAFAPKAVPVDYYYRIPVRPIYKGYPVYAPGREPVGYFDSLKRREPEVLWDAGKARPRLQTETDWIRAGELVFDSAVFYDSVATATDVRNPEWFAKVGPPVAADGTLPFTAYVIREKGRVELANNACGFRTVLLKRLNSLWVDAAPDHSRLLVLSRPDPEQGVAEIRLLTGWQEQLR